MSFSFLFSAVFLLLTKAGVQNIDVYTTVPSPEIIVTISQIQSQEEQEEEKLSISIERISAYNPVPRQTDSDPHISSCGPNLERQIAVSRDLFFDDNGRKHLCGKTVTVITDRGEVFEDYVIWDTMSSRYEKTVDIMIPNNNEVEAFTFGITTGTLVFH